MSNLFGNNNFEFEVLNSDEESVTYKRVLNKRLSAKEKAKREMQLPKLTVHYFEPEDLEHLQRIRIAISESIEKEKKAPSLKEKLIAFIMK